MKQMALQVSIRIRENYKYLYRRAYILTDTVYIPYIVEIKL